VNKTLGSVLPLRVTQVTAGEIRHAQACSRIDATAGFLDVSASGDSALQLRTGATGVTSLYLWLVGSTAPDTPVWSGPLASDHELVVRLPDGGTEVTWHLRVTLPAGGSGLVCPA